MSIKYGLKELEKDYGSLTFGRAIEAYRLAEEMSAKEFAKFLGISPQSLCDLEKGRRLASVDRAVRIARRLGEPLESWVTLALEDQIRKAQLKYRVSLKKGA